MNRTLPLGKDHVTWRMPTMVHRLQAVQLQVSDGIMHARAYALVAGLPLSVLQAAGMSARPGKAVDEVEKLLQRPGCTLEHYQASAAAAYGEVVTWYNEVTADYRGNSEPGPDAASADGPTPTTLPASEGSAAPSSPLRESLGSPSTSSETSTPTS